MHKINKLIPVFKPNYSQAEIDAISRVLKSGWIGLGPKTEEFEKRFAEYVNSPYAVSLNSATAALHLSLLAADIGKGDEVIVPSLTFVSTAHAVLYVEATPVFADIEPDTLCISPDDIAKRITKRTRAIIPVHYGGHPCDMDRIKNIAKKNTIIVIEDASHACGSKYQKKMIGNISPFTCFSFHAVKNLATGDGGMITVREKRLAEKLRRLRWVGINKNTWERLENVLKDDNRSYRVYGWYYEIEELGYKYHMNDLNASLGLVQLKKLEQANKKRRILAQKYSHALKKIKGVICPVTKPGIVSAQHNYVIRCENRDKLHLYLREKNISTGVHYMPIHLQPFYRNMFPKIKLPIVESEWKKLLTLPLYPQLTYKEQDYIINCIQEFYG